MMFLENVNEPYMYLPCVHSVINYVLTDGASQGKNWNGYIGNYNIINIYDAANEFLYMKNYFGKTEGRQLKHIILSPDPKDCFINPYLLELAYMVCAWYMDKYQCVFAVHTNTRHPHFHAVINTVSFVNGKKLHETKADFISFERYCRECYDKFLC